MSAERGSRLPGLKEIGEVRQEIAGGRAQVGIARALESNDRVAGVTEKVLPHLEGMSSDSILHRVDEVEKLDRIARRNYGLDSNQEHPGILNVAVLAGGKAMFSYNPQPPDAS